MPSARYWRVKDIVVPATDFLELAEWHLFYQGLRVDQTATLSSYSAPLIDITRLKDASFATQCSWTKAAVSDPAFWIKWDFGAATDVDGTRFAGFGSDDRYPSGFRLEWSTNDTDWTTLIVTSGIPRPGGQTFSAFYPAFVPFTGFRKPVDQIQGDAADPPFSTSFRNPTILNQRRDIWGWGRIVGTTKEKALPSNTPLRRRVYCMDALTGNIVGDMWSDAGTGAYVFNNLDLNRRYTVFSYDHTAAYRAVIADNLQPELMP